MNLNTLCPWRYGITEFTCAQNVHHVPGYCWRFRNIQVLLWNFNKKREVPGKQETKTKLSMNHHRPMLSDELVRAWEQCSIVSVCAQNVSGMVSELSPGLKEPVIGVYGVSCPPPHSHYSAKTRRLHLQPHSILSNSLQTRTILEQRAGLWAGVHRLGGAQTGGNDWGLTERGKRRVWRETLGPSINPSELCFPLAQSGSAATVSLGHSRHSPVTTLRWSLCEVRWN